MLKKILVFLFSLLIVLIGVMTAFILFANTGKGREIISDMASDALDREVDYTGGVSVPLRWPPALRLHGLKVANDAQGRADTMLDIGTAQVAWSPWPLFKGVVSLPYIAIKDSTLHIERNAEGRGNWQFGEAKPQEDEPGNSRSPRLGVLYLKDTTLTYYDIPQKIDLQVMAETEEKNLSITGDGTYLGQAFALKAIGGNALDIRDEGPYPIDATLSVGATTLQAKGTLQNPTELGGMDIRLRVKGKDASELFPLLGIALPPTQPYDIQGDLKYAGDVWNFTDFTGTMGNSDIGGSLTWDHTRERPKFTAEFVSQKLDFVDLGPLIGAEPGTLDDADNPYVIPDVPLDISRLAAMDAEVTFTGHEVISPNLPLDDFLLELTLDNRLLTIHPVKFGTANGDVSANLTINAREEPVQIAGEFSFARLSLAQLMQGISDAIPGAEDAEGLIGGTAKLKGQGKSLKQMLATANGDVGIGMEGGQLSNLLVELVGLDIAQSLGFLIGGDKVVPVRCVVGDFGVTDGIMQSRALIVDTEDTKITGEGRINLASEEMNLRIVPQPKDASLATIRTPLRVEGTMKNPDIIIEKGALLARGAGIAALSVVLTPAAGLIALLEPALGEDSDCTAMIRDMRENTGTAASAIPENANAPADTPAPEQEEEPEAETDVQTQHTPPQAGENIVTHPGEADNVVR